MEEATRIMAICTAFLALFTAILAGATFWLGWEARKSSLCQIGVQTWQTLQARFDSKEMKQARKKLAQQLNNYNSNEHDKISETVLDFFEDVGTTYRL